MRIMRKTDKKKLAGAVLSLALAASVAAASAGCTGKGGTPASAASGSDISAGADASPGQAVTEAATEAAASGVSTAPPDNDALSGSAAGSTREAQAGAAQSSAPQAPGGSDAGTADTAGNLSGGGSGSTAAGPAFSLHREALHEALEECTGFGQSAGSSLRSVTAATELLCWANAAGTGNADATTLEEAVKAEVAAFTDEQIENMKGNWSSVSFNVSMILNDFDEVSGLLEDAGCLETARHAAADENAFKNWKAAEKALDTAMQ